MLTEAAAVTAAGTGDRLVLITEGLERVMHKGTLLNSESQLLLATEAPERIYTRWGQRDTSTALTSGPQGTEGRTDKVYETTLRTMSGYQMGRGGGKSSGQGVKWWPSHKMGRGSCLWGL